MRRVLKFLLVYKIYDFLNIKLSMFIFRNFNLFTYNLFNYFYRLLISNKNVQGLKNFINFGHQKLPCVDINKIESINKLLDINQAKSKIKGSLSFNISSEISKVVNNILDSDLKTTIEDLEKNYNGKVIISGINASRNYNVDPKEETYSNYLHNDGYIFTTIQIFINLMDIDRENGPLEFIDQKKQKEFIKKLSFFNVQRRFISKNYFKDNELNYNIGKRGDALLFNTSDYLHGAGIPEKNKYRDILFIRLSVIPKSRDLQKEMNIDTDVVNIFNIPNNLHKMISKPTSISQLFSLFFKYYKSSNKK